MNSKLLQKEVQDFISENWNADPIKLILKKPKFPLISQKELVTQLECKKKARFKLPTWFASRNIIYPEKLNIEQSSSEKTAHYKSRLVAGKALLDLTGGFGVDSFYFSKKMETVTHCESNTTLSKIAAQNSNKLGVGNCHFIIGDGLHFLMQQNEKFDWIYVDPSRRHDQKGKVFRLLDCTPNIPEHIELLFKHTNAVLLKVSPLLDLALAIKELKNIIEIHVVAVQNEVKELLFILKKNVQVPINIQTVNLQKNTEERFAFLWDKEKEGATKYGLEGKYLYEPNAAILKAGAFISVAHYFELTKLADNSHLYSSKKLIDFPGRIFEIVKVMPYNKKTMKILSKKKANVTTRNFSDTVSQIRKKYNILEGGETYLFFTKNSENRRFVLQCKKV